jgi:hypothetical protein
MAEPEERVAGGYGVAVRLIGETHNGDMWEAGIATREEAERKAASGYTGPNTQARVVHFEDAAPWADFKPVDEDGSWHVFPAATAPRTVDLAPTWEALLPAFLAVLADGTEEGKRIAREELRRMAQAADFWNARCAQVGAPPRGAR